MTRKIFIIAIVIIVLAISAGVYLKKPMPPPHQAAYRVGVVLNSPTLDQIWEGFREGMHTQGYEEGRNITYVTVQTGKDYTETKTRVAGLMDQNIDLLYPLGVLPTRAGKEISEERHITLPILFGILADPVGLGIVGDLKNSGNNITGISSANEILSSKRLELFLEAAPSVHRVVIAWNDAHTSGIAALRKTAQDLGVEVMERHVENLAELDAFLTSFQFRKGDGLLRASDSINALRAKEMALLARQKKIPLAGTSAFDAEQGALISYGADYRTMGRQAARLAYRILTEGALPTNLPIEVPEVFALVVNLKTAQEIASEIPSAFLSRADRIIR